jgi:hypothetical protein
MNKSVSLIFACDELTKNKKLQESKRDRVLNEAIDIKQIKKIIDETENDIVIKWFAPIMDRAKGPGWTMALSIPNFWDGFITMLCGDIDKQRKNLLSHKKPDTDAKAKALADCISKLQNLSELGESISMLESDADKIKKYKQLVQLHADSIEQKEKENKGRESRLASYKKNKPTDKPLGGDKTYGALVKSLEATIKSNKVAIEKAKEAKERVIQNMKDAENT